MCVPWKRSERPWSLWSALPYSCWRLRGLNGAQCWSGEWIMFCEGNLKLESSPYWDASQSAVAKICFYAGLHTRSGEREIIPRFSEARTFTWRIGERSQSYRLLQSDAVSVGMDSTKSPTGSVRRHRPRRSTRGPLDAVDEYEYHPQLVKQ